MSRGGSHADGGGARGVPRFVYPSSGSIYGAAARDVPLIDEDTLLPAPVSLYGLTKRAAETLLPRVAETQGVRFAAARLGSVYGPWEYATGVRDTLSPMLQALECARRGEEAVLGPAWRGDFIFSRDVADGLVRLADAPALSRTVYNLGSGRLGSAGTWCEALARVVPGFRWRRAAAGEAGNVDSTPGSPAGRWRSGRSRGTRGLRRVTTLPTPPRHGWRGTINLGQATAGSAHRLKSLERPFIDGGAGAERADPRGRQIDDVDDHHRPHQRQQCRHDAARIASRPT